jgi:hypothetical protein
VFRKSAEITNVNSEREMITSRRQRARKRGHAEIPESKEKRVGRLKKARTHSQRIPEREDPQGEAKKEIKARK